MKNGKLIELILSGELPNLTIGEIEYYNKLTNRELDEILKVKQEFRTQIMSKLKKEDFVNEEDYYYILSKINELNNSFDFNTFVSMAINKTLQNSKYYRKIIDKLLKTNGAGYIIFIRLLEDNNISKLEYIDDIIKVLLESNPDKLSLISNKSTTRSINLLKSLLLNQDLMQDKDKYLAAVRIYISSYEKIRLAEHIIKIITNKYLIKQENYIELLEWIKTWSIPKSTFDLSWMEKDKDSTPITKFSMFLQKSSEETIETFLFKYNTLEYFAKTNEIFFFKLFLDRLNTEHEKTKESLEFAIKFFDTFIKNNELFKPYIQIATAHDNISLFTTHNRKYKEVIDITKRIKERKILNAYMSVALSYKVLKSKHWRYILNTVASAPNKNIARTLAYFFDNEELLKREDLRSITALGLNCEDKTLQEAFFEIAKRPYILKRPDYLKIIELTFKTNKQTIKEYIKLATSDSYINSPYFYDILLHATQIDDEELFKSYTQTAKRLSISNIPLEKEAATNLLSLISSVQDEETMEAYDYAVDNIFTSLNTSMIDKDRVNFSVDILTKERENPNYIYIIYIIGDRDILPLADYEEIVKQFIEIKEKEKSELICDICDTQIGAAHIKEILELEKIEDLRILKAILFQLTSLSQVFNNPTFITRIISKIKNKDNQDLYFVLELLSKETTITPILEISYEILYNMGFTNITEFTNEFESRYARNNKMSMCDEFVYKLRNKKREIKKEVLLKMLSELNPEDEVDITKIKNVLSLKQQA